MANKSFYVDEIYRNENDDFYTGLALEHNEWLKDRYKFEKVADPYTTCRGKTVRCEYSQIFYPDSQMLLCNDIASVDGNLYDNIENGELCRYYDADGNEVDVDSSGMFSNKTSSGLPRYSPASISISGSSSPSSECIPLIGFQSLLCILTGRQCSFSAIPETKLLKSLSQFFVIPFCSPYMVV